jgi:hypothetical protein
MALALLLVLLLGLVATGYKRALLRTVRVHEAVIVRDRFNGTAKRLVFGPHTADVLPFVEDAFPVDLRPRTISLSICPVVTADGLPLAADMDVLWAVSAERLAQAHLDEILPVLENLETHMRQRVSYALRQEIATHNLNWVLGFATRHGRLEKLVQSRLQDLVAFLGVEIESVRLICQLETTMLNARVAGEARAQELMALTAVLGQGDQMEALMRLEMLKACQRAGGPVTAFDLPNPFANGNGSGRVQFVIGPH